MTSTRWVSCRLWIKVIVPDALTVFELTPVPLAELHDWLEREGVRAWPQSVRWERWDVVEVRDGAVCEVAEWGIREREPNHTRHQMEMGAHC